RISPFAWSCTMAGTSPCIFSKSIFIPHLRDHRQGHRGSERTESTANGFEKFRTVKVRGLSALPISGVPVVNNKKPAELFASLALNSCACGYLSLTPPPSRHARDGGGDDDGAASA